MYLHISKLFMVYAGILKRVVVSKCPHISIASLLCKRVVLFKKKLWKLRAICWFIQQSSCAMKVESDEEIAVNMPKYTS